MTDDSVMNDIIEQAYWKFDAMRNGYAEWSNLPKSERDAFKAACASVLEAENAQLKAELAQARYLRENAESALNTHMEIHARVVNELRTLQQGMRIMASLEQPHALRHHVPSTASAGTPSEVVKKEAGT